MQPYHKAMQPILGYCRRVVTDYNMIEDGDRVAVGVSGGKDSVALLVALCRLREIVTASYEIIALTIDPCFGGNETDYSPVTELCVQLGIKHVIKRSELGQIIFEDRKESNPCSLCARMRRGMLHDMANQNNCNKVALGHNSDDAVETLMMNLFHEGRIGCFQPVTWLSRKEITVIRPLVYAPEREIRNAVANAGLPVVKSCCPVDGATSREKMKKFLLEMEQNEFPRLRKKLLGALRRSGIDNWREE